MKHFLFNISMFILKFWLKLMIKMIYIHNVYNSSSTSYLFTDNSIMLLMIERQLQIDVKYVLMKDFNLYYLL